jgi:hypothetical protein
VLATPRCAGKGRPHLDLRHASKMEHVEAALAALGLRLIVDVARAA